MPDDPARDEARQQQPIGIDEMRIVQDDDQRLHERASSQRVSGGAETLEAFRVHYGRVHFERCGGRRVDRGENLFPRPVRTRAAIRPAGRPDHPHRSRPCETRDLSGKARLADPGFAREHEHAAMTVGRCVEHVARCGELALASNELVGHSPPFALMPGCPTPRWHTTAQMMARLGGGVILPVGLPE